MLKFHNRPHKLENHYYKLLGKLVMWVRNPVREMLFSKVIGQHQEIPRSFLGVPPQSAIVLPMAMPLA